MLWDSGLVGLGFSGLLSRFLAYMAVHFCGTWWACRMIIVPCAVVCFLSLLGSSASFIAIESSMLA